MFLTTDRSYVREFKVSDLEEFASIVSDEEVMRFSLKGPLNKEEAQAYLQKRILDHYSLYGYGLWALTHKEDQCLIGFLPV